MSETRRDMTAMADEPGDELTDWRLYDVNQAQLCHFLRAVSIGDDSTTGLRESWRGFLVCHCDWLPPARAAAQQKKFIRLLEHS
jgi:hypothetical protein